jgi:hypothetical protein
MQGGGVPGTSVIPGTTTTPQIACLGVASRAVIVLVALSDLRRRVEYGLGDVHDARRVDGVAAVVAGDVVDAGVAVAPVGVAVTGTLPSVVAPSTKVTVPVAAGIAPACAGIAVTVAVNGTGCW